MPPTSTGVRDLDRLLDEQDGKLAAMDVRLQQQEARLSTLERERSRILRWAWPVAWLVFGLLFGRPEIIAKALQSFQAAPTAELAPVK